MAQIGFTEKQSSVFHRFNALRRAYEDANGGGRIYNPSFLTVLMDAWEERQAVYAAMYDIQELQPVVIRSTAASAMYLHKCFAHDNSYEFTNWVDEAMVFDNPDQAKAFLQKTKRNEVNWIFEPVNESK